MRLKELLQNKASQPKMDIEVLESGSDHSRQFEAGDPTTAPQQMANQDSCTVEQIG